MLLSYSAELWAKNDYESCNLPSAADDGDAQDDNVIDDNDDDDAATTTRNINYVIGDVLQPQNSDNTDAVIVHSVGEEVCDAAEILSSSVYLHHIRCWSLHMSPHVSWPPQLRTEQFQSHGWEERLWNDVYCVEWDVKP